MAITDKRIDAYIAKAQPFAQPVLHHFRALVHKACPQVEETIKWGMPFFDYKGPMCHMAAFKQHCAIGFWKAGLFKDRSLVDTAKTEVAMGHVGRITSLKDLPADRKLMSYIKEAVQLNENNVKLPPKAKVTSELIVPPDFIKRLKASAGVWKQFEAMSPSHKKAYVEWITQAKKDETKIKRMNSAIEMIAAGKKRM